MAASLMILTGRRKALRKSNPIQPLPRLWGSRRGHSLIMGPGNPSDTQSNFQSRTDFLTTRIILPGVMVGPDGYLRGSVCPLASILMFVPPTSITRTLGDFAPVHLSWLLLRYAPKSTGDFICATKILRLPFSARIARI